MRKKNIERVFADAKEKHGLRYTHLCSLTRVSTWVRLKFVAMNLKKLALRCWETPCFLLFPLSFTLRGNFLQLSSLI